MVFLECGERTECYHFVNSAGFYMVKMLALFRPRSLPRSHIFRPHSVSHMHSAAACRRKMLDFQLRRKCTLIGGPRSGPPINGMDQAVLDQEGDINTFNNRIYRITARNYI